MSIMSSWRYVSIKELADNTSISRRTWYDWARQGKIPGRLKIGGRVVFREDAVRQWLKEQERKSA